METDEKAFFNKIKPIFQNTPIVFDIGTNHGEYTDMMIEELNGKKFKIYSFEPNQKLFLILKDKYKNDDRVYLSPFIVSDFVEDKLFYYFTNNNDGLSSIYNRPVFSDLPVQKEFHAATTLDEVTSKENYYLIDFIKVDVEGAEFNVLRGAKQLLVDKRIMFLQIEYGYTYADAGIKLTDVIAYLERMGYKLFSFKENKFIRVQNFKEDYHFENYLITYLDL